MLLAALCLTEIMTSLCKDCGQVISISGASLEIHGGSAEVGRFLVAQKKVGAGLGTSRRLDEVRGWEEGRVSLGRELGVLRSV